MKRKEQVSRRSRNNKAIFALAAAATHRDREEFWRWLRPRLGATDYDTLVDLDPEWIAAQDANGLYAEWVSAGKPHRGSI